MNYLGLDLLPKKLSIFGPVFVTDNLWARILCANWSIKIVFLLEILKHRSNCVRHQHCFLHIKMMGQEHFGWSKLCLQDHLCHQSRHCQMVKFSYSSIASSTSSSIIYGSSSTCTQFSANSIISYFVKEPSLTSDPFIPQYSQMCWCCQQQKNLGGVPILPVP